MLDSPMRWEYKVLTRNPVTQRNSTDEVALNKLGGEGWELVGIGAGAMIETWYLKRKIE